MTVPAIEADALGKRFGRRAAWALRAEANCVLVGDAAFLALTASLIDPSIRLAALSIQALRNEIGDTAFFRLLKGWPQQHAYGNASVADFVTYAEQVSGKPLAALFDTWLFQPVKPAAPAARAASFAASPAGVEQPRSWKKIEATNDVHGR